MRISLFPSMVLVIVALGWQGCRNSNAFPGNDGDTTQNISNEHLTMAVLYQQKAAEYRALCYQAFNMAKMQVEQSSKILGGMKKKAVIMDIDETVLDNSPYEAICILDSIGYPTAWDEWVNLANASPVPGALEFVKYAASAGVEVYYVSNRKEKYLQQTLKNLKDLGFPFAMEDHLLLRTDQSSKQERWNRVKETANVILMIGDNLNDFSGAFENKSLQDRFAVTDSLRNDFGKRFIVLPNAMYGEWENALYHYDHSKSPEAKKQLRHQQLIGF